MAKVAKYMILVLFNASVLNVCAYGDELKLVPMCIYQGDTIPDLMLPQVYVYPELVFKNKKQEKFYWRTVRDVKKTLPYAKLIGNLLKQLDKDMAAISSERERKNYMKAKEDELYAKYEPEFKKMTLSQGKMLIRLVDRECDRSSYEVIKEFRGGFRAFFWQGFARLFGANLKATYDTDNEEDRIVERVITLVEAGQL